MKNVAASHNGLNRCSYMRKTSRFQRLTGRKVPKEHRAELDVLSNASLLQCTSIHKDHTKPWFSGPCGILQAMPPQMAAFTSWCTGVNRYKLVTDTHTSYHLNQTPYKFLFTNVRYIFLTVQSRHPMPCQTVLHASTPF